MKKRSKFIYNFCRWAGKFILKKYRFETDVLNLSEPYVVCANHLTEVDAFMLMRALPNYTRIVAGEHLKNSFIGKLIDFFLEPIFFARGRDNRGPIIDFIKAAKNGENILIFPEGCRSFNGETIPVHEAMGKLIKSSGINLVTYKITGGYFVAPRWSYKARTGKMSGKIVHVYKKEELLSMTPKEIADAINNDIYENAYETQKKVHEKYKGKNIAEGIENYLQFCPKCLNFDTFLSKGNRFHCKNCGMECNYTEEGFIEGNASFSTVYDWGKWQKPKICEWIESIGDEIIHEAKDVNFYKIGKDCKETLVEKACVKVYKNHMTIGNRKVDYQDIKHKSLLYYGKTLLFSTDTGYFKLKGENFHALVFEFLIP